MMTINTAAIYEADRVVEGEAFTAEAVVKQLAAHFGAKEGP